MSIVVGVSWYDGCCGAASRFDSDGGDSSGDKPHQYSRHVLVNRPMDSHKVLSAGLAECRHAQMTFEPSSRPFGPT